MYLYTETTVKRGILKQANSLGMNVCLYVDMWAWHQLAEDLWGQHRPSQSPCSQDTPASGCLRGQGQACPGLRITGLVPTEAPHRREEEAPGTPQRPEHGALWGSGKKSCPPSEEGTESHMTPLLTAHMWMLLKCSKQCLTTSQDDIFTPHFWARTYTTLPSTNYMRSVGWPSHLL